LAPGKIVFSRQKIEDIFRKFSILKRGDDIAKGFPRGPLLFFSCNIDAGLPDFSWSKHTKL
jgi:hypothetical protein